jgi:HEAT repeat protein
MGFFGPNIKKMKANKDIEGLIEALEHKDLAVRRCAAEALGKIGDARAVEPLIRALKGQSLGGSRARRLGP